MASPRPSRSLLAGSTGFAFPVLIVSALLVIVTPLPAPVMDMLLAGNVTAAVVILLTTIYVNKPLDFSVFPSILLGTTLSRLVLNVASTRLILTRGATDGTAAAGGVIEAFGNFVSGDSLVVGLILFVILVAIQFLVITKGATRISEVAARFALDGMPGKQMAIDADLNAGLVTAEQAKQRRQEVSQQADFYGAMDGASKFVRGDAIAGIVITVINILGGLYIGMVEQGMPVAEAAKVFTTLTIGDGLVSQVPGFLISLAAALLVTRTSADSELSKDVIGQTFRHPQAMFLAATFLGALALTGLPMLPMFTLGAGCAIVGLTLMSNQKTETAKKRSAEQKETAAAKPEPKPEDQLLVDPLELELGVGLIRLADPAAGGDLLDRVTRIRHKVAQELGLILPKVRIRDNIRLDQREYRVKIRDVAVAKGEAYPEGRLAIDTGAVSGRIPGLSTVEPAFGRPAVWIDPAASERAELLGYSVVEPSAVLITHLTEVVREHSAELLTRQQVHQLLEHLKQTSPKLIEELIPDVLKVAQIHQVLANLLRERVPIRDLEQILETLGDYADRVKDLGLLTEYVRHGLARTICRQLRDADSVLHVITLDPAVEDMITAGTDWSDRGLSLKLAPQTSDAICRGVADTLKLLVAHGRPPVLLCGPQVRAAVRLMTQASLPKLAVISLNEVTRDTQVEAHGQVDANAVLKKDSGSKTQNTAGRRQEVVAAR